MASIPDNRRRLADLMEHRRVELGLRWKQVAEAGGISYEAIRAVRNGDAEIRALTKHGIDVGLQWVPGSVDRILEGRGPALLAPVAASGVPAFDGTPDAEVFDLVLRSLTDPLERMVWETTSQSVADRIATIRALRDKKAELTAELHAQQQEDEGNGTALARLVT